MEANCVVAQSEKGGRKAAKRVPPPQYVKLKSQGRRKNDKKGEKRFLGHLGVRHLCLQNRANPMDIPRHGTPGSVYTSHTPLGPPLETAFLKDWSQSPPRYERAR
ncbi:hypothetical protein NPIL_136411 [Nephila pilipes]|uniref:Uncharacterized protein n=1 Tax=Nephila pilipes TaxID=299642 RepID=A0A8X6QSK1_NEPPI|nr:hypothetical protein NPIL_136411 [Nephila pilipes]